MGMDPPILEGIARIQHWKMAIFLISCPSALDRLVPFVIQTFLKTLLLTPSAPHAPSPPAIQHPSLGLWKQGSRSQGKEWNKH